MPPVNDNFASATAITGASGSDSGTTSGATNETGEPIASYPGVWYKYTAVADSVVQFDLPTAPGTSVMVAYANAGFPSTDDRLAQMQPGDTYSGVQNKMHLGCRNGDIFYIKIGSSSGAGAYTLTWATVVPPDADLFASATTVPMNTANTVDMSNSATSHSDGEVNTSSGYHKTVWRKFVAAQSGTYTFSLTSPFTYVRGQVYRDTGGGLAGLVDMLSGGLFIPTFPATATLTAGQTYYIRISATYDNDTIALTVSPAPFCINAIADPNSGSATVTVLGDAVREVQKTDYAAAFANGENLDQGAATSMFYVRGANLPPPGKYTVTFEYRRKTGAAVNEAGWSVFLKLNGQIIGPVGDSQITTTASLQTKPLTGYSGIYAYGPDTFPIYSSSDVIEVCAQNDAISGTPDGIEITKICFTQVSAIAPTKPRMYPATMADPEVPLGSASFDSAFNNTNKYPDTKDMVVTNNGDVYVLVTGRQPGTTYYIRFYKYTAATNTWSTVDGDVWGLGNPNVTGRECWNAQLVTDGTDVWMSWGQNTTVAAGPGGGQKDWVWRCKKYNTSANTFTELGTGQAYYSHASNNDHGQSTGYVQAGSYDDDGVGLFIGPDGKLWAAWVEENPASYFLFSTFAGAAANLDGGLDNFGALDGTNPAARDGSGNAGGTVGGGESGSYFTAYGGEEVSFSVGGMSAILSVAALPTGSDWIGYDWSIVGQGTSTRTYYRIRIKPNNDVIWERVNAGVVTLLKTWTAPRTWAVGDLIEIGPFTSGVNVYHKSAAASGWTYMGSSGTDGSPLPYAGKTAISFFGTSGKWEQIRAGDTGHDQRPCVFYWNGSSWVNTALELIPGGLRRSNQGQTVGTVKNSENARHIQLTFCHADGPNNNPSVFYSTEHNGVVAPYQNQELQLHYNEYNGSSWGTCVTQGTNDVWGSAMYDTRNSAPYYYASNGFPQGFNLFTLDGVPCITMCVITGISNVDLVGFAKMASDRSGFLGEAEGNPDDPIRLYTKTLYSGPWMGGDGPGISTMVDSRGQIFTWVGRNDDQFGCWLLMRGVGGDPIGTGSNWGVGATINNRIRYTEFDSYDKLYIGADDSVYVLAGISGVSLRGCYVYKWDPSGAVLGALNLSRIRFRAHQVGDA